MANMELGAKLKWYRKEAHMTLQEVANALGVSNGSTVSSWESGKSEPDAATILKIGRLYNITNLYSLIENKNDTPYSSEEISLIYAYRAHPELHDAIKRMLEIQ